MRRLLSLTALLNRPIHSRTTNGDAAETTAKVPSSIIAKQQDKLASAVETDTPDLTKALVVAGYERHRVVDAVRHASEVQLPAARLIFVCPVSIGRAGPTPQFSTSVKLRDFCGRSIVAALQRTEDVDFHFRVPYLSEADSSKDEPEILEGRIFYHPSSDDCVLKNLSDLMMYASRYDRKNRHRLQTGSTAILEPVDVLILPRRFCVVRTARTTDHAKRAYADQPETNVLHKRLKTVHPAAQPMLERPVASSSMTPVLQREAAAPVTRLTTLNDHDRRVAQMESDVLLHLRDGEVAIVKTSPHLRGKVTVSVEESTGHPAEYQLSRLYGVAALAYLNKQGVTHNDIKPMNIAYSPARGAVLLDFGMASMDADEKMGGTPPYMPPEYADGRLRGHLGDVWAAGVTLLIVLRKLNQPVRADCFDVEGIDNGNSEQLSIMRKWLEKVAQAKATLNLNEADDVESLVGKMLDEDRSKRISAEQVQQRLLLANKKKYEDTIDEAKKLLLQRHPGNLTAVSKMAHICKEETSEGLDLRVESPDADTKDTRLMSSIPRMVRCYEWIKIGGSIVPKESRAPPLTAGKIQRHLPSDKDYIALI
ncbi:hypothetical protein NHJ13734_003178 [Beauveria thailandica]